MSLEQGDLVSVPVEWDKAEYWDEQALDKELRRQYDICNGCRMCFNLCPGFPKLFDFFDAPEVDHDPEKLADEQVSEFVDLCFNCKVCFIKCPYTPPHKFLIDIPKVVMRARAVAVRKSGDVSLSELMLTTPDKVGEAASKVAPLVNLANTNRTNRWLMEKTIGVHRDKILPKFHTWTFARWFSQNIGAATLTVKDTGRPRVAIFHTCIVNYNEPQIGKAAVRVLQQNDCEIADPAGQTCCGMPYIDAGRLQPALEHFRANIRLLLPYARQGWDIVVPEPSCAMMLRKEYTDYLQGEERMEAYEVAKSVFDLSEYLMRLNAEGKLKKNFPVNVGRVAYHQPCHLKYQAIGQKSIELLRLAGAEVIFIDKGCSGHDGTWAMKKQYFQMSQKVASKLHRGVNESEADLVATDCSLAGIQIQQGTGRTTLHPIEVLARAYGIAEE